VDFFRGTTVFTDTAGLMRGKVKTSSEGTERNGEQTRMERDNRSADTPVTPGERLVLWARILDTTDEMLRLAQRGDWQTLDTLSLERETWLQSFFASPLPRELHARIKKDIRHIQTVDIEVVRTVQKNRAALTDEITRLQARKKRIKDYLSNCG